MHSIIEPRRNGGAKPLGRAVAFNGKFLSAHMTGVHRVAHELLHELDLILLENPALAAARSWEIIQPRDAQEPLSLACIPRHTGGLFTWQPWEQFDLPRLARGRLLVNLCNLAPLAVPGTITMLHDAQVYISPGSYSSAFRAWYQFALPRIGAAAARILTVSEYSKAQLVKFGVAPPAKIEVIHNGGDHILRTPSDGGALARLGLVKGRYALALANTQKHKNIAVLLRAMALPAMSDLRLVLVGSATAADFAAAGTPAPDNVVFTGRIGDAEMRGLMESAACFAMPSTTEGFGLPPLEAMFVGCPVVVAPCGALPEACGSAAAYVAPGDAEGWAREIARLASNSDARSAAVARGLDHAPKFTWRRAAQRLLDIVLEVTSAPASSAGKRS